MQVKKNSYYSLTEISCVSNGEDVDDYGHKNVSWCIVYKRELFRTYFRVKKQTNFPTV